MEVHERPPLGLIYRASEDRSPDLKAWEVEWPREPSRP